MCFSLGSTTLRGNRWTRKVIVIDRLFLSFAKAPGFYEGPSFIFMELNKCEAAGVRWETIILDGEWHEENQ